MKIIKIVLSKYERLMLNNIQLLEYTPNEIVQFILGTNGSGKSSLLRELSPLPAVTADYLKGGYKYIEIEHNGNNYKLKSDFSSGSKHTFIVNDTEILNNAGTSTVQKELVEQHFGLTNDIHELMVGIQNLTTFSPAQRRKWLTRLSNVDYTYALNTYQNLKDRLRDFQGALKLANSKLIHELNKALTEPQRKEIEIIVEFLQEQLRTLLDQKKPITKNLASIKNENAELLQNLIVAITKSITIFKQLQTKQLPNALNVQSELIDAKSKTQTSEQLITITATQIEKIEQLVSKIEQSNLTGSESIDVEISKLQNYKAKYLEFKNKIFSYSVTKPKEAIKALASVKDVLLDIFSNMPCTDLNQDSYTELIAEYSKVNSCLDDYKKQQVVLELKKKEIEHLKQHNKIECPQCRHSWINGLDTISEIDLIKQLKTTDYLVNSYTETQTKLKLKLEEAKEYLQYFSSYKANKRNWNILQELWDYIDKTNYIKTNPRNLISVIAIAEQELSSLLLIEELDEKIKSLEQIKDLSKSSFNKDFNSHKEQLLDLHKQLYNYNLDFSSNYARITACNDAIGLYAALKGHTDNILKCVNSLNENSSYTLEGYKQYFLNKAIEETKLQLSQFEQKQLQDTLETNKIKSLEADIKDLTDKIEKLKMFIEALSPTSGLIGKSIKGFIDIMLNEVNSIIAKVWLYPMRVLIKNDEEEFDLDYKFAIQINDEGSVDDVTQGSKAMQEIINVAFRIVSMKYLGMLDYPIYLDEFGHSMDPAHRNSAINMVSTLISQSRFSQIFIVSHYEESLLSVSNADINVLCNANLRLSDNLIKNERLKLA